ncbi:MAG: hypothetical protein WAX69_08585 [Victivallales bacterium]
MTWEADNYPCELNDQVSPLTSQMIELFIGMNRLNNKLKNKNALRHAQYGIGRRLRVIRVNVCNILQLSHRPEKLPFYGDRQSELGMHLNSFYIHLHGTLDNLAWLLAFEMNLFNGVSEDKPEDRRRVGLFRNEFMKALPAGKGIAEFLETKKEWHTETKKFRDPIAHRIPLYAVPCMMTNEQCEDYNRLERESFAALTAGDIERHDELEAKKACIGTYHPVFGHDADNKPAIYPIKEQIEIDSKNLLDIMWFFIKNDEVFKLQKI